jgi:hypothetical protein
MTKMLITRPDDDIGSNYLFLWSGEVIDYAKKRNWAVEKAEYDKATRKEFESRIKNKPDFVFINGHGEEDLVHGHSREVIVDLANSSILKNTIVFARACNCLKGLGKESVARGCRAFIGYWKELWVPRLHSCESVPLQDPLAKPVLEVSNAVPIAILKGHTVEEAFNTSNALAEKHLLKLLTSNEQYDRVILRAMLNNASALGYEGDKNAKIECD